MRYFTPDEYYFRIHHVRPRFKNDVESVLLYMAEEICKISDFPSRAFKKKLNDAIYLYPGNAKLALKTINNWRTEISALFGFIREDSGNKTSRPGEIAIFLDQQQDLVQFFKYFLYTFQYPGGHIKPASVEQLIRAGIKFKPAHYILRLLKEGESVTGSRFGISKAELTHCVFNDLRVTRDNVDVDIVISLILENRRLNLQYDWRGDVIRYAGDILDYMVIANLLISHGNGYYYLNQDEVETIDIFINSDVWFNEYDSLYGQSIIPLSQLNKIEDQWFDYVNSNIDENLFKTDVLKYLGLDEKQYHVLINERIENIQLSNTSRTKEIGDLGESLVLGHEWMRVKLGNREDLIHLIKKIPTALAVGYDIQSVELDATKRYIEVKTTISNSSITFFNFHLTPNEWSTAESLKDRYFVYRLMISKYDKKLYIIQNPVQLYKDDSIKMVPRNGADVVFTEKVCAKEVLLIWKN